MSKTMRSRQWLDEIASDVTSMIITNKSSSPTICFFMWGPLNNIVTTRNCIYGLSVLVYYEQISNSHVYSLESKLKMWAQNPKSIA